MYYPNSIEEICYKNEHVEQVLTEIRANFSDYYYDFINTDGGSIIDDENLKKLAEHFGSLTTNKKKNKNVNEVYSRLISEGIQSFEKIDGYWRGRFQAMASPCDVLMEVEDELLAQEILNAVANEAWRIEDKFSRYKKDNIILLATGLAAVITWWCSWQHPQCVYHEW